MCDEIFICGIGTPRKGMEDQAHLSRAWSQPKRVYSAKGISPALSSQEAQGRYWILIEVDNDTP